MNQRQFKTAIYAPTDALYNFLHKNLVYQNLALFYTDKIEELSQYIHRAQPKLVVVYLSYDPEKYIETVQAIQKMNAQENLWVMVIVNSRVSIEKLRAVLPIKRIFIHKETADYHQIAHNILSIKNIDHSIALQAEQSQFEENINHCMRIVYQEKGLNRIFERLVNYFPKVIRMDYWGMFSMDKNLQQIDQFSQFVPPTRRKRSELSQNLYKIVQSWLKEGRPFLRTPKDEPQVFAQLTQWGWPITQLYFLPINLKDRAIGGLIVGNIENKQLSAQEIRFLNEVVQFSAKRILDESITQPEVQDVSDFSDQLLSDHSSEETIFRSACKKLNEITHSNSATYWKYNKGFGFLFPQYVSFLESGKGVEPQEKDMIFIKNEPFLSEFIDKGKVQSFTNIAEDDRLEKGTLGIFNKIGYRNVLILPLKIHQEITGAIIVNKNMVSERFNIVEIHKAEEIIKRTENVIEDTQTVKEANLKLKQLARIFELGNEIKLDLSRNEILKRITGNLRKTLGWNDIVVLLKDDQRKIYAANTITGFHKSTHWAFNFREDISATQFDAWLDKTKPLGDAAFYSTDTALDFKKTTSSVKKRGEWKADDLLCLPLETRNQILGYLVVHDPVNRMRPTLEDIIPLAYYANQAAIAVENSLLYEQLRTSQERYRTLAETMSIGLVRCDIAGNIVYVNPASEELFKYPNNELLGKDLASFFSEASQNPLWEMCEMLMDGEHISPDLEKTPEFTLISESGENTPVAVLGFPFYEANKLTGFFLILNDLRMIKRMERMKADFNSMIVHDLRSPMNVIQGFIELIRNRVVGEVNSEQEELLDIAKENVKKVLALVDNFLVASKLEVGKFEIDPKLDELNQLIQKQVQNHRVLTKSKNIILHLELDKNLPLLYFDNMRIDQVLNNLLSNAMKFTPENGNIYVKSAMIKHINGNGEQMFAQISVRDTGVGIPQDSLTNVFDKYEQVDDNQKFNIRGTGLGLSICKEIVELHGGEIHVDSAVDVGSDFVFQLPIESSIEKIIK